MRVWLLFLTSLPVWPNAPTPADLGKVLAHLPLSFESSNDHLAEKYLVHGEGYTAHLSPNGIVFASKTPIRMEFVGAKRHAHMEPLDALHGVSNYYIGSDPAKWRVNVPTYGRVKVRDVYPGIDLVFYGNNGELEYDWLLAKGADPFKIRMRFRGATVRLDSNGDVILRSASAEIRQRRPRILQDGQPIQGEYEIRGKEIAFRVPNYDPARPLVIDPALVYSTYLNTNTSGPPNAIAVDAGGNVYIVGTTLGLQFGVSNSPQPSYGGGVGDAFLIKLDRFGNLVYSTYLGGPGTDNGEGVAVDSNGNAYITGSAQGGFPLANALQPVYGGGTSDVFVAKLQSSTGVLVYSTYLGGPSQDVGVGIAIDSGGYAYVTG